MFSVLFNCKKFAAASIHPRSPLQGQTVKQLISTSVMRFARPAFQDGTTAKKKKTPSITHIMSAERAADNTMCFNHTVMSVISISNYTAD